MIDAIATKFPALLTAWTAFGLAAISPGPNMLAVMARAFGSGRGAAVSVAAGIATGAFLWATATAFGLAIIAERFPWIVPVTGLAGGTYLLRLGILRFNAMRSESAGPPAAQTDKASVLQGMMQGFIVIASNPKVALFWISISAFIVRSELGTPQVLVFAAVCSLLAFTIYATAATIFSDARMRALYFRSQQPIDLCFAALFAAIGIYLLWYSIGLLA
jgi:threonine efflux protein